MKLMTKEIERKLERCPFNCKDGIGDNAEVVVKFFGGSSATWLVLEGEKQSNGDWMLYGLANLGYGWEYGYFMLSDIEDLRFPPFGLPAERDIYAHGTVGMLKGV